MDSIEKLSELFQKFPGIGPRQARRFVQFLLVQNSSLRSELGDSIKRLGLETQQCSACFRWFVKEEKNLQKEIKALCPICADPGRDSSLLFVVEKDADLENVERSSFRGLYLVLGGVIPLASDEIEKHIRVRELLSRVERDGTQQKLKEVILGLSATTEGDHTRLILQEKLLPIAEAFNFKISSLGRGLSTGSELEYADPDTIASAFSSRA